MMDMTIPACSKPNTKIYKALDLLEIKIEVDSKDQEVSLKGQDIELEDLFEVAVRKNKKRLFLFVSKILGKHLAVRPSIPLLGGQALAELYDEQISHQPSRLNQVISEIKAGESEMEKYQQFPYWLNEPTLFIGFAETATGLGHSMFSAFRGEAYFIHTTREKIISQLPSFAFEEVHSHATGHLCYTEDNKFFENFKRIILVDDEITTSHTALNLIEAISKQTKAKQYVIASLLDWRDEAWKQKAVELSKKLNVEITFISLVQGKITWQLLKEVDDSFFTYPKTLEEIQNSRPSQDIVEKENSKFRQSAEKMQNSKCFQNAEKIQAAKSSQNLEKTSLNKAEDEKGVLEKSPLDFAKSDLATIELKDYIEHHVVMDKLLEKITQGEDGEKRKLKYMCANGRFGLKANQTPIYFEHIKALGQALKKERKGGKCLCVGSEEFIYLPCLMAYYMGEDVLYQSTTRSPIQTANQAGYPLKTVAAYKKPEDNQVMNYIYNIMPDTYEEIFMFLERDVNPSFKKMMSSYFKQQGVKQIHFVCCDGERSMNEFRG